MALNPEILFPERILKFGSYEDVVGSIEYATAETNFVNIGKLIDVDVSDIDGTIITHYDRETAKIIPIIEFSNGAKLCLSCYVSNVSGHDLTFQCLFIEGVIICNGVTYYAVGSHGGVNEFTGLAIPGEGVGAQGYFFRLDLVKTYGIKIYLCTDFSGQLAEPEVTKANRFYIKALIPYQSYLNQAGFQSFSHVYGSGLFFTWKSTGDPRDWVQNPQYLWYGYGADLSQPTYYLEGWKEIFETNDFEAFITRLNNLAPVQDPDDVYSFGPPGEQPPQDDDPSGPGGGDGKPDPSSDPIPFPTLPTGGALSSGAIKAFSVTPQIMAAVFQKLWNTSIFDISNFQKLTNSPLDNIISLQCIPITPTVGTAANIKLGNFDTEQAANQITKEYYTIDCGSLKLEKYWGSALDYQPYTRVQIFLPFIGIKELDTDDVMGKTLHIKYNYSIFDGNLTAQIMCGESVLYKFNGNARETIPVTAQVSDALQRAFGGIASGVAMGVAGGAAAGIAGVAISTAVNVAMSKTQVQRSGDLSGSTGLLDDFRPFLIIHRPIQSLANNFKTFKGYPSNISGTLGSLSGYTEVEYIHLTGIDGATDTELAEIEALLKKGVII